MFKYITISFFALLAFGHAAAAQDSFWSKYTLRSIDMGNGLQHNFIDDIIADDLGFIWIATNGAGFSRYDGYSFEYFDINTTAGLKSNFIYKLVPDNFGRLWIASDGGIDIFDINRKTLVTADAWPAEKRRSSEMAAVFLTKDNGGRMWYAAENNLYAVELDAEGNISNIIYKEHTEDITALCDVGGNIWIGSYGRLYICHPNNGDITLEPIECAPLRQSGSMVTKLFLKDNEIWIGTDGGLFRFNPATGEARQYASSQADENTLSQNRITDIVETSDHQIVVATLMGINIYNPLSDTFERITQEKRAGSRALSCNFVNCLFAHDNLLWVGTEICGIDIIIPNDLSVRNYIHDERPGSISANCVNTMIEDAQGNLWVGNVESGLNLRRRGSNSFEHFTVQKDRLAHNSISALAIDGQNRLWAGTWGGGVSILDLNGPAPRVTAQFRQINSLFVGALIYDKINDGVWVGTAREVVFVKDGVVHSPINDPAMSNLNGSLGCDIDDDGRIWLGTSIGLIIIDAKTFADGKVQYRIINHKLDAPESNMPPRVTFLYKASDGSMYVGTNGYGLYRCTDAQRLEFENINTHDGLVNNSVRGVAEDNMGNIWVSTNMGMSVIDHATKRIVNYTTNNGMLSDSYYWNAAYKSAYNGKLYFGSLQGLTEIGRRLTPTAAPDTQKPAFTELWVSNNAVAAGTEMLPDDIARTPGISLHESDKSFAVEFASLNFRAPEAVRYQYRLVGFDTDWIDAPANRRIAQYTDLPPGRYTLEVRSTNRDGKWSEASALDIDIEPYFYKTFWFYLAISLLIGVILYRIYVFRTKNLEYQKQLLHIEVQKRTQELQTQKQMLENKTNELERQNIVLHEQNIKITEQKESILEMSNKIQKLTVDKLQFFTNISHEIRTPITLIIGPVQRALKMAQEPQMTELLQYVERNAKYLLQLVNQLMDFRKIETGNFELHPTSGYIVPFMTDLAHPFAVYASERNIKLETYFHVNTQLVKFDVDAMNKTMANLLSNAIKFSQDGGRVQLFVASVKKNGNPYIYICVRDSGVGIKEDDIEKIFNRFYQSDNQNAHNLPEHSGTGIGLYLCKKLVEAAGGEIVARPNPGGGSSFRILVPLIEGDINEIEAVAPVADDEPDDIQPDEPTAQRLTVLIVEDNNDMRSYIKQILSETYNTVEARDGMEGLTALSENNIDFIICDLMMPVMDGLEFSKKVNANFSFSHIPILILTAQMSDEYRTQSYKIGVESYLTKPFDEQMLLARISGILDRRRTNQLRFQNTLDTEDLNIDKESDDEKFVKRVLNHIKENYTNPDYSIDDILHDIGCSKSMLNKKMQNVIGQSPGVFIRNYRLNVAKQLIIQNKEYRSMNISQIAYEVGFNDPKYFTRCFTKHYCITPSGLLDSHADIPPVADDDEVTGEE